MAMSIRLPVRFSFLYNFPKQIQHDHTQELFLTLNLIKKLFFITLNRFYGDPNLVIILGGLFD